MFKKIVVVLLIVLSLLGLVYSQSFAQQKALKFHNVPTTDTGKVACWATNATTGEVYLSSCSTLTASSVVVSGASTTTCPSGIKTITITAGIVTAATCTP